MITKENTKVHNPIWLQNTDHWNEIHMVGGSRSGKTQYLVNLIN